MMELNGCTLWAALTVDMEEIERIEVIRGPGSALFGANAFAGVVNITTMTDSLEPRSEAYLVAGEDGFLRLQGTYSDNWKLGEGVFSVHASVGDQAKNSHSDPGFRNNVPFRTHGIVRYRQGRSLDLSLHAGAIKGHGHYYTHIGDMQIEDSFLFWVMGQGEFELAPIARLKSQVYFAHYNADLFSRTRLQAFDFWIADFPDFYVYFPVTDGQLQLNLQLADNLLLIGGANLRYQWLHCDTYDPQDSDELRGAGFVHVEWTVVERLELTGGLRFDLSNRIDPAVSPRFVVVARPWAQHAFRLGYGLAFRKPSLYESRIHVVAERFNPATPEIVDVLPEALGNEDLTNEKVHSFEAGWLAQLLDNRLRVSADLFFNIYLDSITFLVDLEQRMGMPVIRGSTIRYVNDEKTIHAMGGEVDVSWRPEPAWAVWANLGLRHVTYSDSGDRLASEPVLRANLGGRYSPGHGPLIDLALHYVTTYQQPFTNPENILNQRQPVELGNALLLVGRLGYRIVLDQERVLECGLTIRAPLSRPFREFPGGPMPPMPTRGSNADWGGEVLNRLVSLHLRGSF
jgi:iron complex outermembrane receptor protein